MALILAFQTKHQTAPDSTDINTSRQAVAAYLFPFWDLRAKAVGRGGSSSPTPPPSCELQLSLFSTEVR